MIRSKSYEEITNYAYVTAPIDAACMELAFKAFPGDANHDTRCRIAVGLQRQDGQIDELIDYERCDS